MFSLEDRIRSSPPESAHAAIYYLVDFEQSPTLTIFSLIAMLTIRSLMFITVLPTPILALAAIRLSPNSPVFPIAVACFATLTGLLIAGTTTRTRNYFFRKIFTSSAVAAFYFVMIFAASALWSQEWSPSSGIAVVAAPIHRMAAVASVVMVIFASTALTWLAMTMESSATTETGSTTQ